MFISPLCKKVKHEFDTGFEDFIFGCRENIPIAWIFLRFDNVCLLFCLNIVEMLEHPSLRHINPFLILFSFTHAFSFAFSFIAKYEAYLKIDNVELL